jgi:hypothetical protein
MPRPKGVSRKERAEKKALEKKNAKQKNHLDDALLAGFVAQPEVILAFMNATIDKIQDVNAKINNIRKDIVATREDLIEETDSNVEAFKWVNSDMNKNFRVSLASIIIAIISLIISGVTLYLKLS